MSTGFDAARVQSPRTLANERAVARESEDRGRRERFVRVCPARPRAPRA
jgi:hypothetical protein